MKKKKKKQANVTPNTPIREKDLYFVDRRCCVQNSELTRETEIIYLENYENTQRDCDVINVAARNEG